MASPTALPSSLRVVEIGGGVAAYTAHFLAALGAEVIKVEPPDGDPDRDRPSWGGTLVRPGLSAHFLYFNANKKSVVLTPKDPAFRDLVESADILIDASGPDVLTNAGCGYESLLAKNRGLVVLSQTPFGLSGPYRDYHATSPVVEAMSGFAAPLGNAGSPPIPSPNDFLFQVAALQGSACALAAWREVRRTGVGQVIEMSLQDVGTHMQGGALDYAHKKIIRHRRRPGFVTETQMHLPVKDGWVIVQPVSPAMWKAFVDWVGEEELAKPEYQTTDARGKYGEAIEKIVLPFAARFSVADFPRIAQERRIPCSPINPPAALLDSPQAAALGSFIEMSHPDIGTFKAMGYPISLSVTPMSFRSPAPRLGEHQDVATAKRAVTAPAPKEKAAGSRGALEGVRILDFTHVLAGPTATQVLGFLGAEIVKIETRSAGLEPRAPGYAGLNRAKKAITLDAKPAEGKQLALELAKTSDVVIDNFSAGVMGRLGLAYDDLKKVKPDIIAVSINGWGRGGPMSSWSAFGPTLQAYTGVYWLWRHEGAPVNEGIKNPPADFLCAAQAVLGIIAAVTHRELTGEGQCVELVMLQGLGHCIGPAYLEAVLGGDASGLHGHRSARWAPFGRYQCAGEDEWCDISVETEREWEGLKRALGNPSWASDPKLSARDGRLTAFDILDREICAWTRQRTPLEAMTALQAEGVAAGMVQNAADLVVDPHLRARGQILQVQNPAGDGTIEVEGMGARFSRSVTRPDAPAPQIGQHNAEIYGGLLGLSAERITQLEESKAIY